MKYYAVTDDPNELMHYGVLGMKWGVVHDKPRHPGSGRRSSAYKKAQGKLGKMMRSGIKKAEASWKAYNSPEAKYQRQTNKALQQARKGKLKYGKLSDDQVRRITERLSLERQARQVSETEKTIGKRLRESIGEGIISGIGRGFGNRASEFISRGSVLKTDRMKAEQQEEFERRKDERKIRNATRERRRKEREEAHKEEREYKRDKRREQERMRDAYEYGAEYDSNGKLNFSDQKRLESYYEHKYLDGTTRTDNMKRQYRESIRNKQKEERQRRLEESRRQADNERELAKAREKADAEERARYRRGVASLSAEASRRDSERAWNDRNERMSNSKPIRIAEESRRKKSGNLKRPGSAVPDWQLMSRRSGESSEDYAIRVNRSRRRNTGRRRG